MVHIRFNQNGATDALELGHNLLAVLVIQVVSSGWKVSRPSCVDDFGQQSSCLVKATAAAAVAGGLSRREPCRTGKSRTGRT